MANIYLKKTRHFWDHGKSYLPQYSLKTGRQATAQLPQLHWVCIRSGYVCLKYLSNNVCGPLCTCMCSVCDSAHSICIWAVWASHPGTASIRVTAKALWRYKHVLISHQYHIIINNSERPVDAPAEKHISLTDNLKSRDASASKKYHHQCHYFALQ